MNTLRVLSAMVLADFRERTRRTSFLVTVCLVIYLGYAVNTGQIFIKLDTYRGIYNSAWVGGLMTLIITFFLGLTGFYLVKNAVERDERTGVGQILATTPLSRVQYLVGKWLSNFIFLAALVGILALAAVVMQVLYREAPQIQLWALLAPFLLIALPMMALVAAIAVFFETVGWLKGGFGNLVYFFVFMALFMAGIFLTDLPWLDVTGLSLVSGSMKSALRTVYPGYSGSFVLSMASGQPIQTFAWTGLDWTIGLFLQRALWLGISAGLVLFGSLFFNRFDPNRRSAGRQKLKQSEAPAQIAGEPDSAGDSKLARLSLLAHPHRFQWNFFRLVWLEILLLVKGLKWYWLAGMALLWLGSLLSPEQSERSLMYMLVTIWPVLVWSKLGEREVRYQTEQLVYPSAYPLLRLTISSWLAGILITAGLTSGALLGGWIAGEPMAWLTWLLSVIFIPTLALTLGTWSRGSKLFEVVYPILWYLGPFNRENGLVVLDYLGLHSQAPVNTEPLLFSGFLIALLCLVLLGRQKLMRV